ncbi:MAG: NAD-dependent malic enzyme [Candidatus Hydrogenedentota bacterium]
MPISPSASYSFTIRVKIPNKIGMFAKLATAISKAGGSLGAVDLIEARRDFFTRDVTIEATSNKHEQEIVSALMKLKGFEIINVSDRTFLLHLGGKLEVISKVPLRTRAQLSMAYTPGVARVCNAIAEDKRKIFQLTIKKNTVAVVTDGSAVLGLGDIGPEAALPVMEGKAQLFKEFGGVDAFPICLNTKDVGEIVNTVKRISTAFGGINLEDISAPRCFEIEDRLKKELDIPVFHDDQHGTAVVVLAALYNALKIVKKDIRKIKVAILGIGAAGIACTKILRRVGVKNIIGCDRAGIIYRGMTEKLDPYREWFAKVTNPDNARGNISEALRGADVFIGVSGPGLVSLKDIKKMNKHAIVFALANPVPEIMPEEAWKSAEIVATGRSDYPNQINNVLCFPGLFKGALKVRASEINEPMKVAAAYAIAKIVKEKELSPEYIIPSVFNKDVVEQVARAVADTSIKTGIARKMRIEPGVSLI